MAAQLTEARIGIWIGKQFVPQGKICKWEGKPIYLASMTKQKYMYKIGGYAIAKRILDSFSKLNFNPLIVYTRDDLGTFYTTRRGKFQSKGVLVPYGGHQQYVLPMKNWKAEKGRVVVPKDFNTLDISEWEKAMSKPEAHQVIEDLSLPNDVRFQLKEAFFAKYPELRRTE